MLRKICTPLSALVLALLLLLPFTSVAMANSAEPPTLTVIVSFPPDDLSLSLRFADGSHAEPVLLYKEQKAWESRYRFFNWMDGYASPSQYQAVLIVQSSEFNFECLLPESATQGYSNLVTLDLKSQSSIEGQSLLRAPLLVSMRVVLTLFIEGLIFFAFGYRKRSSWIAFLVINLITQGFLNVLIGFVDLGAYALFAFIALEFIIFLVEILAFVLVLKEHKKPRAALYAFAANLASLILGGALITLLPV